MAKTRDGRRGGVALGVMATVGAVIAAAGVVLAVQGMEHYNDNLPVPVDLPEVQVEVTEGTLRDTVHGTISASPSRTINVPAGGVVTRSGAGTDDSLRAGDVIGVVEERPIFLMPGDVPVYRSLTTGSTGRDVEALHQALTDLGYTIDAAEKSAGRFGWTTARELYEFYLDRHFTPVDASGNPVNGNRVAETGVPQAEMVTSPSLPLTPTDQCGTVGETVTKTLCVLAGPPYRLTVSVNTFEADRVEAGQQVWQDGALLGTIGDRLEARENANGSSEPTAVEFSVIADDNATVTAEQAGPVDVLIAQAKDVAIVDAVAIRGTPEQPWVQSDDGTRIDITVGLCVSGRCEVDGVEPGAIVVIGVGRRPPE